MRVPSLASRSPINEQTALTPLIDVIFQLLIFFMCASTGHLREQQLAADLPAGGVTSSVSLPQIQALGKVEIRLRKTGEGVVADIEGQEFSHPGRLRETLRAVAEAANEIPVILQMEADVPMGWVIEIYDACQAAGFRAVNFATHAKP